MRSSKCKTDCVAPSPCEGATFLIKEEACQIFRACFAFTMTTPLPKIFTLRAAFVAGFFTWAKPGTVKLPTYFTSPAIILASASSNASACLTDVGTSHLLANRNASVILDMARAFLGAISGS